MDLGGDHQWRLSQNRYNHILYASYGSTHHHLVKYSCQNTELTVIITLLDLSDNLEVV